MSEAKLFEIQKYYDPEFIVCMDFIFNNAVLGNLFSVGRMKRD